jgi:Zn-dependent peptidase ImmA (M78 family)
MDRGASLRYGFKTEAEQIATEVRAELGLDAYERFDPRTLAAHLDIQVIDMTSLVDSGASLASVRHFQGAGKEDFSAVTIVKGYRRIIVVNDAHALVRQASSLGHELSHVLLEHEPHEAVSKHGCRRFDAVMEAEANWLGGVLLVPRVAALHVARNGIDVDEAAAYLGVSLQMMRWRLGQTGAARQAEREQSRSWSRPRRA